MRNIGIAGPDVTSTNSDTANWATNKQLTTSKSKLYELVLNVPTAIGADRIIWFFDTASGTTGSADAVFWVRAYYGVTTVLNLNGKLFTNGIYYVVGKAEPDDAAAKPTDGTGVGAADDCLVTADYRVIS